MDAPALMTYSEVVRDWRFYDTKFGLLRQSNSSDFPWESTHWELRIRAQNFNNARFSKGQAPQRNRSSPAVQFRRILW
jgi:hypothetical protein